MKERLPLFEGRDLKHELLPVRVFGACPDLWQDVYVWLDEVDNGLWEAYIKMPLFLDPVDVKEDIHCLMYLVGLYGIVVDVEFTQFDQTKELSI